ncbi:MAG: HEAT repeat domain-containing protein [Terriglobia bacterium]
MMSGDSMDILQRAVVVLALSTIAATVAAFFLIHIQYRRQLARQARRVVLAAQLVPGAAPQALRALWSKCNNANREIVGEILINRCRLAEGEDRRAAEQFLIETGTYERWLRETRRGSMGRRIEAVRRLGYIREPRGVEALEAASGDKNFELKLTSALSLGRLKDPRGLPALIRMAQDPRNNVPDLTLTAALAACANGHSDVITGLLRAPQGRTRMIAAWTLSEIADTASLPALSAAIRDPDPEVRAKVARALARIPGEEALDSLADLASDPVPFVRVRALDALGRNGSPTAEPILLRGLDDPQAEVRHRSAASLRQIYGTKAAVVTKVLATGSRRSFNALISEWQRAGFLHILVAGLSPHDRVHYAESQTILNDLIAAGMTQPLLSMVLVFPNIKIRLRLLRFLRAASGARLGANLQALAGRPECDPRIARAIRKAEGVGPPSPGSQIDRNSA